MFLLANCQIFTPPIQIIFHGGVTSIKQIEGMVCVVQFFNELKDIRNLYQDCHVVLFTVALMQFPLKPLLYGKRIWHERHLCGLAITFRLRCHISQVGFPTLTRIIMFAFFCCCILTFYGHTPSFCHCFGCVISFIRLNVRQLMTKYKGIKIQT